MATTIAFDFLYQLTIFPAIVAVTGRLEQVRSYDEPIQCIV